MSDKSNNITKGRVAENIAMEFLVKKGYDIVETNYRYKKAEIDIIAIDEGVLVFVEVKSRSSDIHGSPELGVNFKKMKMIVAGAVSYMEQIDYDGEIRFDIISILLRSSFDFDIEHYEDAFFPGL